MTFRHPFQKLCYVQQENNDRPIILASTGPVIWSISVSDGKLLSRWPSDGVEQNSNPDQEQDPDIENAERPAKRQKTESGQNSLPREVSEASDDSLEIVAERKKGERRRPKVVDPKLPNVSHLLATRDGKYVVVVTTEDKSVKVFQLSSSGGLQLLSERSLPKRLCAIKLTTDERTLLAADKFGDVYSLPLHPSKDYVPKAANQGADVTFSPSATELTVHTKGNRQALQQQLKQKAFKPKKEGPDFEHQLILGHVSLLTDLAIGEGEVAGQKRPYILTADRDEHIRVSRGIPQAHVIESYCLGHQDFVSKLCIPTWATDLLIAGNGEPSLRVFEWQTGEQVSNFNLSKIISDELKNNLVSEERNPDKLAISGLCAVNSPDGLTSEGLKGDFLVVLEGCPVIFAYSITDDNHLFRHEDIQVKGNVLDIVEAGSGRVIVSLDSVHKPASMKTFQEQGMPVIPPLQAFEYGKKLGHHANGKPKILTGWKEISLPGADQFYELLSEVENPKAEAKIKGRNYETVYSTLGEFLYGLENLRKKRDGTAEEEAEEAADVADAALQELEIEP